MSKKTPKPEPVSRNQIAIALSKEFRKSIRTCWSWFDRGCPETSIEDARAWAKTQPLRSPKEPEPEPEPFVDSGFDSTDSLETLATAHPKEIETILTMREHGIPQTKICDCTGWCQSLVSRILRTHPRTKELERSNALADWKDIRRLATGRIKAILEDPSQKLRLSELGVVAGVATDKIKDDEAPPINLSIRAKIEAMSYDELIKAIRSSAEVAPQIIEGQIEPLPRLVEPEAAPIENASGLQQRENAVIRP